MLITDDYKILLGIRETLIRKECKLENIPDDDTNPIIKSLSPENELKVSNHKTNQTDSTNGTITPILTYDLRTRT